MANNVFISGAFDCIGVKHLHLIKEAKKLTIPNGKVVVLLLADYTSFLVNRSFPVQPMLTRRKNLEYFIKPDDILAVDTSNYNKFLESSLANLEDYIYMHYDTDKEFVGRDAMKKLGVKIRFIKEPKI